MDVTIDQLIREAEAAADKPLEQLDAASETASAMSELGDALLTHFVDKCRRNGHTWAEIGTHLGVTRQAVQKRFTVSLDQLTVTLERFTGRARGLLDRAVEVARGMNHTYVGTEHLLLAQFDIEEGLGAAALKAMGIRREQVEDKLAQRAQPGLTPVTGDIPYTPRARKALMEALAEALQLGHNYIGTEHLLLGLLRQEGWAQDILTELGGSLESARSHVVAMLAGYVKGAAQAREGKA